MIRHYSVFNLGFTWFTWRIKLIAIFDVKVDGGV